MKNLTWQNPEQLFVAQELINKVKSKCCGIKDNKKVYEIAKMLQEKGIFTIGIVYPAVRTKEARLRVSVLATHKLEQLESLVNTLNDINKNIKIK